MLNLLLAHAWRQQYAIRALRVKRIVCLLLYIMLLCTPHVTTVSDLSSESSENGTIWEAMNDPTNPPATIDSYVDANTVQGAQACWVSYYWCRHGS